MRIRFDRGTLVLEREQASEDPGQLPGAVWDDEVFAWRVPAETHDDLVARLTDDAALVSDEVGPADLDGEWTLPPLRWYQEEALAAWEGAGRRGVIALPTGSGKTMVAIAAIARLGVAALVLVPTRVLLDQWASALAACWQYPSAVGRLGDGERRIGPVTVATYASGVAWAPRIGDRFGLVVVDEAHHVGAWCPGEILEMMVAPARLGLTATPPLEKAELVLRIGPIVFSLGVADLEGDGLAPYELVTVPVELTRDERVRYRELRGRFAATYAKLARRWGGATWNQFVRAASRNADGRHALEAWRGYRALLAFPEGKRTSLHALLAHHAGERTLVFTSDNATAYAIARELLIMPITYEIGRTERAEMLARFRAGEISVLVSAQVLDEGFDVPDADVAIIVGGTASARRQVQRIGRVLRPRDGKRARVYELAVSDTTEVETVRRRREALVTGPRRPAVPAHAGVTP